MIDPDDFANDWYGWLTNQCGHIVLGLGAGLVVPIWGPVTMAAFYWLVVEVVLQRNRLWRDSIMDTFFVMAGGSLLPAYDIGHLQALTVAAIAGCMLGFGVWKRY